MTIIDKVKLEESVIMMPADAMTITIRGKQVYGILKIYPVCDKAKIFAALTGKKTFDDDDITRIKSLGYRVLVEANPTEL